MKDPENVGGIKGGLTAPVRAGLADIRRRARRYRISPKERAEMVTYALNIMRNAKNSRAGLGAIKTLALLDRLNQYEIAQEAKILVPEEPTGHIDESADLIRYEQLRQFWTGLREALVHIPEAYAAVERQLRERALINEARFNGHD
jgi:hypothetical protein